MSGVLQWTVKTIRKDRKCRRWVEEKKGLGCALCKRTVLTNRGQLWSVECFGVKIRSTERDLMVSATNLYHKTEVDEAAFIHFQEASGLQALVLKREFLFTGIYQESNTVVRKQSGRFPGCVEDSFVVKSVDGTTRNSALLD